MATYSKSVLDALTEIESTQPITVPSTSAIRVTSSAPTITIPGIQPSAGWILQLAFCNVVGYNWAGRGAFGVTHVPSLMSTYTPLVYAVKLWVTITTLFNKLLNLTKIYE
ncbi:uncharacterized protein LOC124812493 isoform X3 [Hydra vulgaris]|uniref:uncharacterized protein LOC124812493 isoform X3 n=1 Tax=Hydra vulgaris TaxID=6087 RepID=UPI0032E9D68B